MGSITEYLNKIITAVKGKDVRQSMHDAIKQVYDDAATSGNANMEVTLARGTEPNLNARLGKMDQVAETNTAQLAILEQNKEEKSNIMFTKDNAYRKVKYPVEMQGHLLPINIYNNNGKFVTDFDPRILMPTRTTTYYVNPIRGKDTNDGLTKSTPFKTLYKALSMSGDIEIRISSGVYYYLDGWKGIDPARGISVICEHGKAILSNSAYPRNWVESATYPGCYTAPSVYNGEDLKAVSSDLRFMVKGYDSVAGFGEQLAVQGDPTNIQSGTVGFNVGTTTTIVRLPFNLNPNIFLDIKYAKDNVVCKVNDLSNAFIYLENIEPHYGLTSPMIIQTSTDDSKVVLINTNSKYSRSSDGLELTCNGLAVIYESDISDNYMDGINYYVNNGVSGSTVFDAIEINCKGNRNGKDSSGANNGTTAHSTMRLIRLNGDYSYNQNRNVHDTGGSLVMNIGCKAILGETNDYDFVCDWDTHNHNSKMWLVGCEAGKIAAKGNGTIYVEKGAVFAEMDGDIQEFIAYE